MARFNVLLSENFNSDVESQLRFLANVSISAAKRLNNQFKKAIKDLKDTADYYPIFYKQYRKVVVADRNTRGQACCVNGDKYCLRYWAAGCLFFLPCRRKSLTVSYSVCHLPSPSASLSLWLRSCQAVAPSRSDRLCGQLRVFNL